PAGAGRAADRDLPAQPVRRVDRRLADRGPGLQAVRWLGAVVAGPVGAPGAGRRAVLAAAVAVPHPARRRPGARRLTPRSPGVPARAGLAGHRVHGAAEPDLLRHAVLAADHVPRSRG